MQGNAAIQSIQSLMLTMRFNGITLSTGTGFIAVTQAGPVLITNRHNVTGRHQVTGKPLDTKNSAVPNELVIHHLQQVVQEGSPQVMLQWVDRMERLYLDEDPYSMEKPAWHEHPLLGARADFVALPLTQLDGVALAPHDIAAGSDIALGVTETVSVVGFPFGLSVGGRFAIWATGFIASEPDINYDELPLMLIDCRTRQGQSGSPVLAFRNGLVKKKNGDQAMYSGPIHKFIGIYSGRVNDESDIGMVWKASAIQELIDSFTPAVPNYGPKRW